MTAALPTLIAAQSRHALSIACALTGDEPGNPSIMARAYTAEALMIVHRDLAPEHALLSAGCKMAQAGALARAMSGADWRQTHAERIAGALLYGAAAAARVIDRRPQGNFTAAFCGDPPPGRSALAQRRSELTHG